MLIHNRCQCGKHWTKMVDVWRQSRQQKKRRWVYCPQCRRHWLTRAKYAERLKPIRDKKIGRLTDEEVVELVKAGLLRVCYVSCRVFKRQHQLSHWYPLKLIDRTRKGTTYTFVEVGFACKRKKVAVHRLMWMQHTGQPIPDGYDVDHKNGRTDLQSDRIENLRLLRAERNRPRIEPRHATDSVDPF